jgi:hypothetical protein
METAEIKERAVAIGKIFNLLLDIDDVKTLKRIGDAAYTKANTIRQMKADCIGWYVGQEVQLKPEHRGTKPYGEIGIVEKVNPKKLKVKFESNTFGMWNIPKTMLQPVE